jgi:hypothetical protein
MKKENKIGVDKMKRIKTCDILGYSRVDNKSDSILKDNGYMKNNGYLKVVFGIFGLILLSSVTVSGVDNNPLVKVAGFRSSDYGGPLNGNNNGHDQTDPAYWVSVAQRMQAKFPGSSPGAQYVVGYIETPETNTYMPFPAPSGYVNMPNVDFGPTGIEEQMLTAFDAAGMKIILQVEPGNANVPKLATMILNKFKNHPCVVGFGVDVEWLRWVGTNGMGSQTNDVEIQTWLDAVHAINPNYKLLVKHWDPAWLGSGHVSGVTYVTDSLDHGSYSAAITDYVAWANHFSGSEIGYQIGYEEDMNWWLPMNDPATSIMTDIKTRVPTANIYSVYWVDFAIMKEFPKTIVPTPNTISVVTPNGGENLQLGSTQTIRWSYTGNSGQYVKVDLLKGGVLNKTLSSRVSIGSGGSGTYSWKISSDSAPGNDYQIRITSASDSTCIDTSDNYFSMTGPIAVISPNGGENWRRGIAHTIIWSTSNIGSSVKIELLKSGSVVKTISSSTSNKGSYNWAISSAQVLANDYKIRITSNSNSMYKDTSDNNFIISR